MGTARYEVHLRRPCLHRCNQSHQHAASDNFPSHHAAYTIRGRATRLRMAWGEPGEFLNRGDASVLRWYRNRGAFSKR